MKNQIKDTQNEEFIDLSEIIFVIKKHWKWFVASASVCLLLAFVYTKFSTPIYEVSTKIFIKDDRSAGSLNSTISSFTGLNLMSGNDMVEDKIEVIKSRTVSEQMVRDLKLYITYIDKSGFRDKDMYGKQTLTVACEPMLPDTIFMPLEIYIENTGNAKTTVTLLVKKEEIASYNINKFPALLETPYGKLLFTQTDILPENYKYKISISNISRVAEDYLESLNVTQNARYSAIFTLSPAIFFSRSLILLL